MRLKSTLPVLCYALAGAIPFPSVAAEWHSPYIYRETSGSWTNMSYDDGICRYSYSHNSYGNETSVKKSGDCSRLAIAPDGTPMLMSGAPTIYRGQTTRSGALK